MTSTENIVILVKKITNNLGFIIAFHYTDIENNSERPVDALALILEKVNH